MCNFQGLHLQMSTNPELIHYGKSEMNMLRYSERDPNL